MPGEINLRTDLDTTLAELNKLSGLTSVAADLNKLLSGIYTKAEVDAAIHSAAMLAATPLAAGIEIQVGDKQYVSAYNETGSATVVGEVVILDYANDYGVKAIVVATKTFPVRIAIARAIMADHVLAWFQVGGEAEAGVEGTDDVAAGDFLEVLNTELAFKKDGAARTTNSGAVAVDVQAADSIVVVTVRLINEQHLIAAT